MHALRHALDADGHVMELADFLEHGLAPDADVVRRQRRWEPVQKRLAGGCHLTRDPILLLESAGFDELQVQTGYISEFGPLRPWMFGYSGSGQLAHGR